MKTKPLFDKVVIEPEKDKHEDQSGIKLVRQVNDEVRFGTVIACGPGLPDEPMQLKEGDRVIFGAPTANEIQFGDKFYYLMCQTDIYMKIEN